MAHNWSGWPGAYCLRCGSGQVLEIALAEGWLKPGHDQVDRAGNKTHPDKWKSEDHKELVRLCDNFCYADMEPGEQEAHRAKIKALQDKLGIK